MNRLGIFAVLAAVAFGAQASWYWPFGDDDDGVRTKERRISELIEPASLLIDEAADLAAEGKVDESVEKYRKALVELDAIERENPERAQSTEFATVRNKRAYVNAAIDAMLLSQVKSNAKAVSVSDTTELEKKLKAEREGKTDNEQKAKDNEEETSKEEPEKRRAKKTKKVKRAEQPKVEEQKETVPQTDRELVIKFMGEGDYASAEVLIRKMLDEKPNGAMALNLLAIMQARQGKLKEAEDTLDRAIMSNPRSYQAYYNMAKLMLQKSPDNKAAAKRYYETGRTYGGPENEKLEALLR